MEISHEWLRTSKLRSERTVISYLVLTQRPFKTSLKIKEMIMKQDVRCERDANVCEMSKHAWKRDKLNPKGNAQRKMLSDKLKK